MITEGYIMQLVREYANSPAGRAAIKKKTGLIYTGEEPSAMLGKYGDQMKAILFNHVNAVIKSVTMDDIVVGQPYQDTSGIWHLDISFREGSLHRDSLDLENYPDGLKNIVLLFAKGYRARNYVYGFWDLPNQTWWGGNDFVHIRSRIARPGNDFLIRAVDEFNNSYGKGIARAVLMGDYKECSENRK